MLWAHGDVGWPAGTYSSFQFLSLQFNSGVNFIIQIKNNHCCINTPGVFQISPSSSSFGLPCPRRDDPPPHLSPSAGARSNSIQPIASPLKPHNQLFSLGRPT